MKPLLLTVLTVACAVFAAPKPHTAPLASVARNALTSDDGGYGKYGDYKSSQSNEPTAVDSDVEQPRSKMHGKPGAEQRDTDDDSYGSYGDYWDYGDYGNYSSYGSYKRDKKTAHK